MADSAELRARSHSRAQACLDVLLLERLLRKLGGFHCVTINFPRLYMCENCTLLKKRQPSANYKTEYKNYFVFII